jgi:hypothetical protein
MRLIDAVALKKTLEEAGLGDHSLIESVLAAGVYAGIDDAPTVDAVPVVHARWLYDRPQHYKCSACKSMWGELMKRMAHFCPNCGAKMDEPSP